MIKWVSRDSIEDYMGKHQHDEDALPLWKYFQSVINWVESHFTNTRAALMRGVDWGSLYNDFRDADLDDDEIEQETARLVLDDDVQRNAGIYPYILTREEKHLNIRAFSDNMKQKAYEKQSGICVRCNDEFTLERDGSRPHHTPGPRTARPTRITARCFVKSVTGRSPHNNQTAPCAPRSNKCTGGINGSLDLFHRIKGDRGQEYLISRLNAS